MPSMVGLDHHVPSLTFIVDLRDYAISLSLLWLQHTKKGIDLILPGEVLSFSDEVSPNNSFILINGRPGRLNYLALSMLMSLSQTQCPN